MARRPIGRLIASKFVSEPRTSAGSLGDFTMSDSATFTWIGPAEGDWNTATNWADVTTGQTPAVVAPGSLDAVIFSNSGSAVTVSGNGNAASITFLGTDTILGILAAGSLLVDGFAGLQILAGATIDAEAATDSGTITSIAVSGTAAAFVVSGILQVGTGSSGDLLSATHGGLIQVGTLLLDPNGIENVLSVDVTSTIEVGSGSAAAGALTVQPGASVVVEGNQFTLIDGNIVNNGLIVGGALSFGFGTLSGDGTAIATPGGEIQVVDTVASSGMTFQIDAGGTLMLETPVAAGNTIAFIGQGAELYLWTGGLVPFFTTGATVTGFDSSDTLLVSGPRVSAASFTQGVGSSPGTLVLTNGTSIVTTLSLTGDFTGETFSVIPLGGGSEDIVATPISAPPGAGTPDADSYSWIGQAGGYWNTATNWEDVTAGQTPAVVAPGSLDIVIVNNATLYGNGDAATLIVPNSDAVVGDLNIGTVTVGPPGDLPAQFTIEAGGTVSADTAMVEGGMTVSGGDAVLSITALALGGTYYGALSAADGGLVRLENLTGTDATISTDSNSIIEIGSAGTGEAGTITVDQGATLTSAGTAFSRIEGNLTDNGLIDASALSLEGGTLSGSGTIAVAADGLLYEFDPIITPGPVFQLDTYSDLDVGTTIVASNTIDLTGGGDLLDLGPGAVVNGVTVVGFDSSDILSIPNIVSDVTFLPGTAGGPGTLIATDNGTAVASMYLAGDYTGDTFEGIVGESATQIVVVPSGLTPSIGTSEQDSYSWIGVLGGDWNDTANWQDVTAGQSPAAVAPGSLDVATISHGGNASSLLTGDGSAASLTVQDAWTFADDLNLGTLAVAPGACVSFDPGATVAAESVADVGTIAATGDDIGLLSVSGTAEIGVASQAGTLAAATQTTALVLGENPANLVDSDYGNIVIGTAAASGFSGLMIESGATVSGQGTLAGEIIDNGLIAGGDMTIYGDPSPFDLSDTPPAIVRYTFTAEFSGSGSLDVLSGSTVDLADPITGTGPTIQLDGAAELDIQASIASGNMIDLIGNANTIAIDAAYYSTYSLGIMAPSMPTVGATINGFNNTDSILLVGETTPSTTFTNGTLSFWGSNVSLDLTGLNGATTFSVGPVIPFSPQAITITPPSTGSVSCFARSTRIATPRGAIPIERLREGDLVLTVSGRAQSIRWIGRRRLDCRRHPVPKQVKPVRITPHAFGENLPQRALLLSPDHAVFIDDVLIPVKYLINGTTVAQTNAATITYYHLELPYHDVVIAEGLATESYLDVRDRSNFVNGDGPVRLLPDFTLDETCEAIWECAGCAPLRIEGKELDRTIAKLHRRAMLLGRTGDRKTQRRLRQKRMHTTDLTRLLNPAWYCANNPDVADAGVDAVVHYITWGRQEGRLPCNEADLVRALGLVDPGTVAFTMADVIVAGNDPATHFCSIGWRERRRPNPYFDTGWYLDTHDVPVGMNPLLHYVLHGEPHGLPPSPHFDPAWYRERYAIGPTSSPLAHYLKNRRSQRVSPLPTFDVATYIKMHAATLRPDRDPYAHFLVIGRFAQVGTDQADRLAA
jgi:hypothetical protein